MMAHEGREHVGYLLLLLGRIQQKRNARVVSKVQIVTELFVFRGTQNIGHSEKNEC